MVLDEFNLDLIADRHLKLAEQILAKAEIALTAIDISRERYSTPLTWARTGGRLELNVAATSLGTTTAWPPPWPAERTSAENAMRDLGTPAGVDQLPGAGQQHSGQQNLDHVADQEGQHSQSQRLAERQCASSIKPATPKT